MINELRDLLVVEDRIWNDHSLLWFCFSHFNKNYLTGAVSMFFNALTRAFTQPVTSPAKLKKNIKASST
jgi:hypothetical protein